MNTQLRFIRRKQAPGSIDLAEFSASLSIEGVAINVPGKPLVTVAWGNAIDVEFLSDAFWDLQVWEFKTVVELLSQSLKARHLVEETVD